MQLLDICGAAVHKSGSDFDCSNFVKLACFFAERDPPYECNFGYVGVNGVCVPYHG